MDTPPNSLNTTFNYSSKLLKTGEQLGEVAKISNGIKSGDDGIFLLDEKNAESQIEEILLRDYLKNSEIHKYRIDKPRRKIIYSTSNIKIDAMPLFKKYIAQYKKKLEKKWANRGEANKYWKLYRPREDIYSSNKQVIITPYRTKTPGFALHGCCLSGTDTYLILNRCDQINTKYLLGLLNSSLLIWIFKQIGKRKGEIYEIGTKELSLLPIILPMNNENKIIQFVDQILAITKSDDYLQNPQKQARVKELEREIDQMVYQLYGLTEEEIRIVEGEGK